MRRTQYRCPYCTQFSSRRWNMKIHIHRRHSGRIKHEQLRSELLGPFSSQISSNIRNSLYKNNFEYIKGKNNSYVHQKHPQNSDNNYQQNDYNYSSPFLQQGQSRDQQGKDSSTKIRDDIRDIYEAMHQLVEIKNMSTLFQSSSTSSFPPAQLPHMMSTFTMQQLPDINAKLKWIQDYAASLGELDNMFRNNKNIGLRGHICNNCFHCWVHPVYSNSKDMISLVKSTKPFPHRCNPEKVADAQINIQDIQSKKNASENELIKLLLLLIFGLWCYFPQNKICLKTEELISLPYSSSELDPVHRQDNHYSSQLHEDEIEEQKQQQQVPMSFGVQREQINCNSIDIDLNKVEKSHWAYRAIAKAQDNRKSSIVIDGSELMDFVKVVKASYGILIKNIDGSTRYFFMYLSFKDN